jgi:hypothetical protein
MVKGSAKAMDIRMENQSSKTAKPHIIVHINNRISPAAWPRAPCGPGGSRPSRRRPAPPGAAPVIIGVVGIVDGGYSRVYFFIYLFIERCESPGRRTDGCCPYIHTYTYDIKTNTQDRHETRTYPSGVVVAGRESLQHLERVAAPVLFDCVCGGKIRDGWLAG